MRWPFSGPVSAPVVRRLDADRARPAAEIHATAFARPWSPQEISDLCVRPEVLADALLSGSGQSLLGFSMSRIVRPEAELLTIVLDPRQRGRKLGRVLLESHLAHLAASGVREVFLEVDENNGPALALYRVFGFAQVGKRPGYYTLKDGTRATALVLRGDIA